MTTGGYIRSDNTKLLSLSRKFGRLCLLYYHETQNIEYQNSRKIAKGLIQNIILQSKNFQTNTEEIKKRNKLKSEKTLFTKIT